MGKRGKTISIKPEDQTVLSQKLSALPLKIAGTGLEKLVNRLYTELEKAGTNFKPAMYLSDSWGCPDSVPVIGIPFYLCRQELCDIVSGLTGSPAEKEDEIMTYLRHESGHAFNYAYRLYIEPEWERVFGCWNLPYREQYRTRPFSTHFVRCVPGWYAQKHPDEDFAETFAVWLVSGTKWRKDYGGTPALSKLLYIDDAVQRCNKQPPAVSEGHLDRPLGELDTTLGEWCRTFRKTASASMRLPELINLDLKRLFPAADGEPAADMIQTNQEQLGRDVHDWTGIDLAVITTLVSELMGRVRTLGLKVSAGERNYKIAGFAVFVTTLAMNYQTIGEFMER